MKPFARLADFAAHLATQDAQVAVAVHHSLKKIALRVKQTAHTAFGHYQPAVGAFTSWAPLADATQADRVRQGYPADEPLLRSGALRDSVSHQVSGLEAVIGSTSDVMLYQELGTAKIPPRAVLGPAVLRHRRKIKQLLGQAAASGIAGVKGLPKYDSDI